LKNPFFGKITAQNKSDSTPITARSNVLRARSPKALLEIIFDFFRSPIDLNIEAVVRCTAYAINRKCWWSVSRRRVLKRALVNHELS
jgi:hypothetical protein